MLIETDDVDWKEAIVYMDNVGFKPACLVSANMRYGGTKTMYGVMVYRDAEEGGDALKLIDVDGRESGYRRIFNRHDKAVDKFIPVIPEEIEKNVKGLGDF